MILYLLQVTFLWSVFSLVYYFILSKKTIYVFNRFYLLLTFVGSLLIPIIPFNLLLKNVSSFKSVSTSNINVLNEVVVDISNKTAHYSFGYTDLLWIIYTLGVVAFMIHFITGLIKILKLKNTSQKKVLEGITVCKVQQENQAFSFFTTVFMHESVFNDLQNNKAIWLHEKAHVKQYHSFDVLLVEFVKIIFWFHPLTYLYRKNIKMNHEYLADEEVLKETDNVKDYQYKLLDFIENSNFSLTSTFNYKLTQKRIIMMTIKTKNKTKVITKVFSLFAVVGILTIIACSQDETTEVVLAEESAKMKTDIEKPLKFVEKKAKPVEGLKTFMHDYAKKFNIPENPPLNDNNEIKIKVKFVIEKDGSFSEIKGVSEDSEILVEEAIRVLKTMPKWIPGKHQGKIVRSTFTLPITIKVNP